MISVPTAAVIGYSSGIVVSYFLIKCKVFGHGWLSGKPRIEFSLFVFSSIIGLIVTYFVAAYIIFLFGQQPQLAKLGSSVLSFFVVYFFRKKIVFRYSYTSD
jgi:putative flippase GtrA